MKRYIAICVLVLAGLGCAHGKPKTTSPAAKAQSETRTDLYSRQINVVYEEVHGTGLLADIFVPNANKNGLGIIDVVSGAWYSDRGKLRDHEQAQMYNIFTKHGYVVFAMRPGSVSKYEGTELLANVQTAIRWVKTHAAEYGVDPNRLGMTGASAGGHLALFASVTPVEAKPDSKKELDRVDTRVKAVSVFFPPTDFTDWGGKKPDYTKVGQLLFTGGVGSHTPEEIDARAKEVSPLYRVSGTEFPPYLIFHGDADPLVPLQQSQVFVDKIKSAGGHAELVIKLGGGHPWMTIPEEVEKMATWFDQQL